MSQTIPTRSRYIAVGVDTHQHLDVAAVMDTIGGIIDTLTIPVDTSGFSQLLEWASSYGKIIVFGIEGTGSYGASLASFLRRRDYTVVEVSRTDRRLRRMNGKSDTLDAENAARSALSGFASAIPKSGDGTVEMIRQLKVAHDLAVKQRAATMVALKSMVVHSEQKLRQRLEGKTQRQLAQACAALRPKHVKGPEGANRFALRSFGRRWMSFDEEIKELYQLIEALVSEYAPRLLEQFGIGVDTAAEILIVVGDNPERIKSEAAFAKLAGISPIPAGSGMTSGRHRINYGGHRQLNAAIYRTVIVRMRFHEPTIAYVKRRTAEGKSKRDIIRCLKRYVIREVFHLVKVPVVPVMGG